MGSVPERRAAVKRWGRYALSWGMTLGLMGWVLHRVPWGEVWAEGARVNAMPVVVAAALSILGNAWLACEKYRLILRALGVEMALSEVILLKLGSLPLKNVLPLKSGEVVRLVYLQRAHGVSYLTGGVSVVLNLGLSVLAVGMMMAPGYVWAASEGLAWAILALLGVLCLVAMAWPGMGSGPVGNGGRGGGGGGSPVQKALSLLRDMGPAGLVRLVGFSLGFEGLKVVNYGLVFLAMGLTPALDHFLRVTPPLILISSLPFTVMGLGLREGSVLVAFSSTAGEASLVSAGLWVSVVEGVVPLLAGLALLKPFMNRLLTASSRAGGPPSPGGSHGS
jgi:glycosyltransferase 2 family protein